MLLLFVLFFFFFFFKQKTAYEMRISDWSSDVCSSDLERRNLRLACRSLFGDAAAEQGSDGAGGQRAPGKGRKERGRFIAGRHGFVRRPGRSRRRDDPPVSHSPRSEEHTSELQSLMRISYAVFCLKKKTHIIKKRK